MRLKWQQVRLSVKQLIPFFKDNHAHVVK